MYIPEHFAVTDQNEILSFINLNSFGQLISMAAERPVATHMPFLLSEDNTKILGHFAKQNPQHFEIEGKQVLVTLQGPHDYISPSWYSAAGVPTWNYQAVHLYGTCHVFTDADKLKMLVEALTNKYEAAFETPWHPNYKATMLGAIVGIEISISDIQCKYKLSQNRSALDRQQTIEQLEKSGSSGLAEAMRRRYR